MLKRKDCLLLIIGFAVSFLSLHGQEPVPKVPSRQDSLKGSNTPERKWWDVQHYSILIRPDYATKTVSGRNTITYTVVEQARTIKMQIDLAAPLKIDSVTLKKERLYFVQDSNVWYISIPHQATSKEHSLTVYWSGAPKESKDPPWDGGVIWSKDSLSRPWISVACQLSGASVWYPCKEYLADEPDRGASLTVVVPDTLVAVGNGLLVQKDHDSTGHSDSYTWEVINPINNYGIAFYIGKYVKLEGNYKGLKGTLHMYYWALDYNKAKVPVHMIPEVTKTMHTFEKWFGPYPFYSDGFKIIEAPYIGMEHQSAIAYGNQYKMGRYKFINMTHWDLQTDRLIVHEMAHEWWGNSITANDIADRWIQEGFAGYSEQLRIEDLLGKDAADSFFTARIGKGRIKNDKPVISRHGIFEDAGDDMFRKGWVIIQMVRAMMDNTPRFQTLLQAINKQFYHQTISSRQLENFISKQIKKDLTVFFEQYLRTAQIPVLEYYVESGRLHCRFTNCLPSFSIPVKTGWLNTRWITPSSKWTEITVNPLDLSEPFAVHPDFYLSLKLIR